MESDIEVDKERQREVIAIIQKLEEERNLPAFNTGMIAEHFEVKNQTIRGDLHDLKDSGLIRSHKFGEGKQGIRIWWSPDGDEKPLSPEEASEITKQFIDWDAIEASDIPEEKLKALAEQGLADYEPQNLWTNLQQEANTGTQYGMALLILIIALELSQYDVSTTVSGFMALLGFGIAGVGLLLSFVAKFGIKLSARGYISENPDLDILSRG